MLIKFYFFCHILLFFYLYDINQLINIIVNISINNIKYYKYFKNYNTFDNMNNLYLSFFFNNKAIINNYLPFV